MPLLNENEAMRHHSRLQAIDACVSEDEASTLFVVKGTVDVSFAIWASSGLTPPR